MKYYSLINGDDAARKRKSHGVAVENENYPVRGSRVHLSFVRGEVSEFMNWQDNILTTDDKIAELLRETRRIAVLGIKPESRSSQPAFYVSKYMQDAGFEIIPVPVYYPEVNEILGEKVYRDLREVPGDIDMVNVFRRDVDIPKHVDEIIEAKPKSVWVQLGIRNDEAAEKFAKAGIKVVQNLCLMVEHRALR